VVSVALIGCTTSAKSTSSAAGAAVGKPITAAQAEVLASILTKNYDAGGVQFSAAMPGAKQATITYQGSIDYSKAVGQATITISGPSAAVGVSQVSGVLWTPYEVLEQFPSLPSLMAAKGRAKVAYLSRAITTTSAQDILLALLLKTASTQRENPGLIQQGSASGDTTFLRTDTLRSAPVDVFHFGQKTTYWVGQTDGVLQRLEANLAIAPGTTVIDFLEHRAVTVEGPKVDEVALAAEVPDVSKALTGRTPATDPRLSAVTTTVTTTAGTPVEPTQGATTAK
jgi:hypothetical protein